MNQFDIDTELVIGMTNNNHKKKTAQEQKRKTKKQIQLEKKRKRKMRIIRLFSLLVILIVGIIFGLVSPLFNIEEIEVKNNEIVSEDTIISLSGLSKGQNLFKFLRFKTIQDIMKNSYIEEVNIKRKLPNKVLISIKERKRSFNVEFLNGYFYINNQGYILEISEEKANLPVIKGISTDENKIVEGNRLNEEDLRKLETILQIMNICKSYELDSKISGIDITDDNNYIIFMEQEKKTIYIGDDSNLSNKILYVTTIIEENKEKEGTIYVNGNLNDNFKPRFREKV